MHNFRTLEIWKDAMKLVELIYQVSNDFPKEERFGLTNQIRRCAVSIPSNIAEGAGRATSKEFNQFLSIATGSSYELETQLILAHNLGYLNKETLTTIIEKLHSIQKRIYRFKQSLFR